MMLTRGYTRVALNVQQYMSVGHWSSVYSLWAYQGYLKIHGPFEIPKEAKSDDFLGFPKHGDYNWGAPLEDLYHGRVDHTRKQISVVVPERFWARESVPSQILSALEKNFPGFEIKGF